MMVLGHRNNHIEQDPHEMTLNLNRRVHWKTGIQNEFYYYKSLFVHYLVWFVVKTIICYSISCCTRFFKYFYLPLSLGKFHFQDDQLYNQSNNEKSLIQCWQSLSEWLYTPQVWTGILHGYSSPACVFDRYETKVWNVDMNMMIERMMSTRSVVDPYVLNIDWYSNSVLECIHFLMEVSSLMGKRIPFHTTNDLKHINDEIPFILN